MCVRSGLECCPKANPEARPPKRTRIYTFIYTYIYIYTICTYIYRCIQVVSSNGVTGVRIQQQERERKRIYGKKNEKKKNTHSPVVHFERNRRKKSNVYYKTLTRALNVDYILIFKQKSGSHSSSKPVFNESE